MSLFQSYENYGKNILNDVTFNLVKVLKGVLVLINFTLYFFALFKKNHFKLGQDVAKNVPLILCIYNKISPLDEHKKCYLGIWIL